MCKIDFESQARRAVREMVPFIRVYLNKKIYFRKMRLGKRERDKLRKTPPTEYLLII